MPRTRVFKSGNSQAVRIPAELAYGDADIELEITRLGDVITIYPARDNLSDVVAALYGGCADRRASKDGDRLRSRCVGETDRPPRSWLTSSTPTSPSTRATALMPCLTN